MRPWSRGEFKYWLLRRKERCHRRRWEGERGREKGLEERKYGEESGMNEEREENMGRNSKSRGGRECISLSK